MVFLLQGRGCAIQVRNPPTPLNCISFGSLAVAAGHVDLRALRIRRKNPNRLFGDTEQLRTSGARTWARNNDRIVDVCFTARDGLDLEIAASALRDLLTLGGRVSSGMPGRPSAW
jgi:hypothetical protein